MENLDVYKRQIPNLKGMVLEGVKLVQLDIDDLFLAPEVYKRQSFACVLICSVNFRSWPRMEALSCSLFSTFAPVSYTHLDVYKRQSQGIPNGGSSPHWFHG